MIDPVTIGVVIGGCSSLGAAVYAWQFPSGRQRFTRCGQRWSQALDESRGETLRSSLGVLISRVGGSLIERLGEFWILWSFFVDILCLLWVDRDLSCCAVGPCLFLLFMLTHAKCWHMLTYGGRIKFFLGRHQQCSICVCLHQWK